MTEHSAEHGPESGRPQDFNERPGLVAAGGFCAPTEVIYDIAGLEVNEYNGIFSLMPSFKILREGTPEWEEQQRKREHQRLVEASMQKMVHRVVGNIKVAQDEALTRAYFAAEDAGLDILWEDPPFDHTMWRWNRSGDLAAYRFIGISLVERSKEHWRRLQPDVPIILRETAPGPYDDEWYD